MSRSAILNFILGVITGVMLGGSLVAFWADQVIQSDEKIITDGTRRIREQTAVIQDLTNRLNGAQVSFPQQQSYCSNGTNVWPARVTGSTVTCYAADSQ